MSPPTPPDQLPRRHLPLVGFIAIVIVYLAIIKVVGAAAGTQTEVVDGRLLTTGNLTWEMIVPLGAALVFVYAAISVLGWWSQVVHDPRPVRRWVWALPIIFAVAIVAGINYGGLADRGASFTILLIIAALCVGFGEEGMFRCIGVTSLRQHGLDEGKVAFWSSLIFGVVHLTNLIGGNSGAIGQAIAVSFAGYFFYLIRRVSRSNILNSILHGGFDFMILSGTAIIPEGEDPHPGVILAVLVYLVGGILVLVRRHHIEPETAPVAAAR